MSKCFLSTRNGQLCICHIKELTVNSRELAGLSMVEKLQFVAANKTQIEALRLAKTLFELSRTTDRTTHFNPAVHTLAAIAAGLPGHQALACREFDDVNLPAEQAERGKQHLRPNVAAWLARIGRPPNYLKGGPPATDFRGAWEDTGTAVVVNLVKARIIHMNHIRAIRDAELAWLDVEWWKQPAGSAAQAAVEAQRQVLRDIPQTFDLSIHTTPETLKAAWPVNLPSP